MELTLKQYNKIRLIVVFILAFSISQLIAFKNFFIPVVLVLIASLLLFYLRRKVKEVTADERDYATGGKSALLAIQIYSWISVICMFGFFSLSLNNPIYENIAITLAFSVCILMLLYSLIFQYYNKINFFDKRLIYVFTVLVLFVFFAIFYILSL
jgi:uncharacterized membrane protein